QKVMLATIESGVVSRSYDVVLKNGTKLEFDKRGNLTEIDCKQGIVPDQLIPQAINNYLKENYEGQSVRKIEINRKEYEVELTNGLDLTFNKHFQLIDIE
ncbi:MAG: PepSY-like domain-containing protein, partial [Prevotella pectinovora]